MPNWERRHKLVAAVYVLLEESDKLLLIRRYNTGYMDGYYGVPSGHLDGNEAPSTAASREALEEVGITIKPEDFDMVHCMVYKAVEGDHERVSFFFKTKDFSGEPKNMEPNKCDELAWFDFNKLPKNIVWELRHALEQIKLGKLYSETNY